MATVNQIVDEYVLRTRMDDQASGSADKSAAAFDRMEASANSAAAAVKSLGDASASTGKVTQASSDFDKIANRVDDVTRAYNALVIAQKRLQEGQAAAAKELAAGETTTEEANRVLSILATRVETAATKWGTLRSEAEANATAQAAWNGILAEGADAMDRYAQRVAAGAGAAQQAAQAIEAAANAQEYYNKLLSAQPSVAASPASQGIDGRVFKDAADSADVMGRALNELRAEFDPLYAASTRYERALEAIDNAELKYAISADVANAARARATQSFEEANTPLSMLPPKVDAYAASLKAAAEAATIASENQQRLNAIIGRGPDVSSSGAGTAIDGRAFKDATASANVFEDELERVRMKYSPLYAASKQYEAELNEINNAENTFVLTAGEANAARDRAAQSLNATVDPLNKVAAGSANAANASRLMGIQFVQTFSGLATGQPLMMTFIQQGHQVVDIALATGQSFSEVAGSIGTFFGKFVTGPMLALTAIVALTAAIGTLIYISNSTIGSFNAMRVAMKGNQDDATAMAQSVMDAAKAVAQVGTLTTQEAREAGQALASNKYFSGTTNDLIQLIKISEDLGATMGKTAKEGAQELAAGLADPVAEAKKLQSTFANDLTPDLIRTMETTASVSAQFALLKNALANAVSGNAKDQLSPVRDAWIDLGNAFTHSTDGWKPFAAWIANDFAASLRIFAGAIREVGQAWDWLIGKMDGVLDKMKEVSRNAPNLSAMDLPGAPDTNTESTVYQPAARNASLGDETGWTQSQDDVANRIAGVLATEFNATASQIAATVGNAMRESSLDPSKQGIDSNGKISAGLFQENGVRAEGLFKAGGSNFAGNISVDDQVRYLMSEIANSPAMKDAWDRMANQTGANAAVTFTKNIERPANADAQGSISARYANTYLGQNNSVTRPTDGSPLNNDRTIDDRVAELSKGSIAATQADLTTKLDQVNEAMIRVASTSGTSSEAYQALQQRSDELSKALYANVDPMTQHQRDLESNLRATEGASEGERAYSAAMETARQAALNARGVFTEADASQATSNFLAKQSQAANQLTVQIDLQYEANQRLINGYANGDQALINVQVRQKSINEAMALAVPGTELYAATLAALITKNGELARSQVAVSEAQDVRKSQDQISYLEAENDTITLGTDAQNKYLAVLQATVAAHHRDGDELSPLSQKIIANTGAIADQTAAYQLQKASMNELQGSFDTVFGDVGTVITNAFAMGSSAGLRFKDLMTSIVNDLEKELLKLAVLNPLKNMLFGDSSPTLSSVGGLLGQLTGVTSVAGSVASASGGSLATLFDAPGTTLSGSGGGFNDPVSVAGSLNTISQAGDNVLGNSSGGIVAGLADKFTDAITSALGNSTEAINIAAEAGNLSNSGIIGASVSNALGFSTETSTVISSATSTIAEALPYIGTAISVISDIATGNYRGAALVATGAAAGAYIGTAVFPGLGTAIGAALGATVGGLIDALLPNHPKHPFEDVELNIQDGHLATGKSVGQLADVAGLVSGTQNYVTSINNFLDSVHVRIANADGNLGRIGQGITGLSQTLDPNTLFNKLTFANDPSDTSQFGVAKGALQGMTFANPQALADELQKIAGFADAASTLGITLAAVGRDITNIQVASVSGGNAKATSTVTDDSGRKVMYNSDLRTALNKDLPGQTFADTAALDAEMQKVSNFITATLPTMLTPTKYVQSDLQNQIQTSNQKYADTIAQSKTYGLDNTKPLEAARDRAIEIMMKPALDQLNATLTSITGRTQTALYGQAGTATATMNNLSQSQVSEQSKLYDQIYQTFGNNSIAADNYASALKSLLAAQDAETAATQRQLAAAADNSKAKLSQLQLATATTLGQGVAEASLAAFDDQAKVSQDQFAEAWADYYGAASLATSEFQAQMSKVEQASYIKRQQQLTQFVNGQAITDRNAAGQIITSLTTYAKSLQSSSNSPLSPQDQYNLALRQFNDTANLAKAGNYAAMQQVQSGAELVLNDARSLFGSGTGYVDTYNKVLDTLDSISNTDADTLTASYMADLDQKQTDQLVAELQAMKAEIVSLRLITQQGINTPSRLNS